MQDIKTDISKRARIVYFFVLLFGLAIVLKVAYLQFIKGDELREVSNKMAFRYNEIVVNRGNIYSDDGSSLLSTSLPTFKIYFDAVTTNNDNNPKAYLNDREYYGKVDTLSQLLADLFDDEEARGYKTMNEYKELFINARKKNLRYVNVRKKAKYDELKTLKTFPIFKRGKYKGGIIVEQEDKRKKPFGILAERTIGYVTPLGRVGLESAYDKFLTGTSGKRLEQKIAGSTWRPVNFEFEVDPQNGDDIITTIDINIQDVTENALLKQMKKHNALFGCAVLMEVKTGEIKAIANLVKNKSGKYRESYNNAIGRLYDPGSTFKLASMLVALEHDVVSLEDKIDCEKGEHMFYGVKLTDDKEHGLISAKEVLEVSSNIGIAKIIDNAYRNNPEKYIDKLHEIGLNNKLGIEIKGEKQPYIKSPTDSLWSLISLSRISIGYEIKQTPLQVLSFYNAIANDGVMVKPMFVKEIKQTGKSKKIFKRIVLNKSVCSKSTLNDLKKMLEGVVENEEGTAKKLESKVYKIAGKTGTARASDEKGAYTKQFYNSSFVGYFPADNPKYSCIVLIHNPGTGNISGAIVAGPVFKEIADKVYASTLDAGRVVEQIEKEEFKIPDIRVGNTDDIKTVYDFLNIPVICDNNAKWVDPKVENNTVTLDPLKIKDNIVPDVRGMGLKDALYILENAGMSVKINGDAGIVKRQSVRYGTKIYKNEKREIIIDIS